MKKILKVCVLAAAIFAAGCGNERMNQIITDFSNRKTEADRWEIWDYCYINEEYEDVRLAAVYDADNYYIRYDVTKDDNKQIRIWYIAGEFYSSEGTMDASGIAAAVGDKLKTVNIRDLKALVVDMLSDDCAEFEYTGISSDGDYTVEVSNQIENMKCIIEISDSDIVRIIVNYEDDNQWSVIAKPAGHDTSWQEHLSWE